MKDYVAYLLKVITQWQSWGEHHRQLKEAILTLLIENQQLKQEIENLKKKG